VIKRQLRNSGTSLSKLTVHEVSFNVTHDPVPVNNLHCRMEPLSNQLKVSLYPAKLVHAMVYFFPKRSRISGVARSNKACGETWGKATRPRETERNEMIEWPRVKKSLFPLTFPPPSSFWPQPTSRQFDSAVFRSGLRTPVDYVIPLVNARTRIWALDALLRGGKSCQGSRLGFLDMKTSPRAG
jgi:hypothetical protein